MKLRHPALLRCLGLVGGCFIRWWMDTLCTRIRSEDGLVHPTDPRQRRFIYAFWHEVLLGPIPLRPRANILISQHADGELIAQVCRHLRFGTVRGSSTRGGAQVLLDLIRNTPNTHIAMTPDGPRGPRRQLQPGLIYLASRTGLPVVPVGIGYCKSWRASSWDRFAVPLPWSGVRYRATAPIDIPASLDRQGLERYRQLVERELRRVTAMAELEATGRAECFETMGVDPGRKVA